jgi:hypothetical protein
VQGIIVVPNEKASFHLNTIYCPLGDVSCLVCSIAQEPKECTSSWDSQAIPFQKYQHDLPASSRTVPAG